MIKQQGVTAVEVSMFLVFIAIVAMLAIPQFSTKLDEALPPNHAQSSESVKAAFALAIATKGRFPMLSEIVEYIDVDMAAESESLSGIQFDGEGQGIVVGTFIDEQCLVPTSIEQPGVSDVVRCVGG